jgi:hypothetical protein
MVCEGIRNRLPHLHIEFNKPRMLGQIQEGISNGVARVKGWLHPDAPVASTLNARFVEPIQVKQFPCSRRDCVVVAAMAIAAAILVGVSITLWMGATVMSKTVGLLGLTSGLWTFAGQIAKVVHAIDTFQSCQKSAEEKMLDQYKKYSDAEIAAQFKLWTGRELSDAYTPAQRQHIVQDTKAPSLERAVVPMLIRFVLKKAEFEDTVRQHRLQIAEKVVYTAAGNNDSRWHVQSAVPVPNQCGLGEYDISTFMAYNSRWEQKIWRQKVETAFELALLLHPDQCQATSLSQLGTLCEYSKHDTFWPQTSQLPIFLGKALNATHGIQSVLYQDVARLSLEDLMEVFTTPKSLVEEDHGHDQLEEDLGALEEGLRSSQSENTSDRGDIMTPIAEEESSNEASTG